jgi:UDP-glucose 4-epimerase
MTKGRRFILTGSEGYLMKSLITKLKRSPEVEKIFGLDIRESSDQEDDKFEYHRIDVTDSVRVTSLFQAARVTDVIHAAWTFNPTKNVEMQDMVDIKGTQNVITATRKSGAENIVYLGSSTCYGQLPEDPNEDPFLQENEWSRHMFKRINASYRYARNKAIVDLVFQNLQHNPSLNVFWIRGAIVIGPNTNNVVSFMAEAPFSLNFLNSLLKKFMFSVGGHNPHMQFISEHDMTEILYRACMERWSGVAM